ncbi:photosynthetic reaction center cytochrome PufC [Parasphingopyxis sp.]|uniref:photosynthetic reaction center cytochrome PufC n=1 Tax=Parasphingopyxis sp. TaxID=1920299 RepID=UPI002626B666|nr:photosynthetic reaction center cytochrome PufC [Parasphingopyxis sp.]
MMKSHHLIAIALAPLVLAGCELGSKEVTQTGHRGTAMAELDVVDASASADEIPAPPYELPPPSGPTAGEVYENVQVLSNISVEEFDYLMAAITEWVVPENVDDPERAGCNYCHNPANLASDEIYTKDVSRRMIQMTQTINADWTDHVQQTGVTCWTCHRGNAVPEHVWTNPSSDGRVAMGNLNGQNAPDPNVGYASLPTGVFAQYFTGDGGDEIAVASTGLYPTDANRLTTMETETTYGLMMHLSQAMGVNCTYCHNTQSFRAWELSTQARATAWFGIRMVRNINEAYITPLTGNFPANRLGPEGDPYKVNCTTCHQGQTRPMGGASMVADYPALSFDTVAAAPPVEDDAETMAGEEVASAE